jgi:hypothetical protein
MSRFDHLQRMSRFDHIRELVRTRARNREGHLCDQELQRELERRPVELVVRLVTERLDSLVSLLATAEERAFAKGVLEGLYMPVPPGHSPLPGGSDVVYALVDLMIGRDPAAHYARIGQPSSGSEGHDAYRYFGHALLSSIGAELERAWALAHPDTWRVYHEGNIKYVDAVNAALEAGEDIDHIDHSFEDLTRDYYDDPAVIAAERAAWDDLLDRLERLDDAWS